MRTFSVSVIIVLMISAIAACSEEEEEPASSTSATVSFAPTQTAEPQLTALPTAEPTLVPGTPSPNFEAFRAFAAEIDAAVVAGDAAFFADRGVEVEITCRGDEQLGQCTNQPAGTVIRGIPGYAWRSDAGGVNPRADFEEFVSDWFAAAIPDESDDRGGGAPRLFALAQSSEDEFLAIASLIRDTGSYPNIQRQCRVFRFSFVDGNWVLRGEVFCYATLVSEDWLSGACAECYDYWEPWTDS